MLSGTLDARSKTQRAQLQNWMRINQDDVSGRDSAAEHRLLSCARAACSRTCGGLTRMLPPPFSAKQGRKLRKMGFY